MDNVLRLDDGLESLLQGASDAVLCATPAGAVVWLNERARALLGLAGSATPASVAELEQRVQFAAADGRQLDGAERPLARALRGDSFRALRCTLMLRGDQALGLSVPVAISAARQRSAHGAELVWLLLRPLASSVLDDRLGEELERRGLLLKEMSHRIKNHLQLLSALLRLQGRAMSDPRAVAALGNAAERIQALAAVHAQLYAQSDPGHVDLGGLLQRLVEELRRGLLDDSGRIEATLERVEVESSQAAALVLIASELLTNAIKHGRPAQGPGRIAIVLRQRGLEAELSVSDNGPGCDPQQTQGQLGTQLMQALAQQLGARLERVDQRPGCRVVLRFEPDRPKAAGAAA